MANLELIRGLADSLGLPHFFSVYDEKGQVIEDSIAIVGYTRSREIDLSLEFINNTKGVFASKQLFEQSRDGQSMIVIGDIGNGLPTTEELGYATEAMSFHLGEVLYCTGIIVKSSD